MRHSCISVSYPDTLYATTVVALPALLFSLSAWGAPQPVYTERTRELTQPQQQPPAQTTQYAPPAQPQHPPNPEPQRPPVYVQNGPSPDTMQGIATALQDMGNKLAGLPESIVNSFRESTPQPPTTAQPPATQQPIGQPPTQQPTQDTPPSKQTFRDRLHKGWFG